MIRCNRLLIIGGEGRNSGKSSLAELIISRFAARGITGIKITPHPHPEMNGLEEVIVNSRFRIFKEKSMESGKDSSRMLRAGAERVFLALASDKDLVAAFRAIVELIPPLSPVVCESPALRRFVRPDLFVIMKYDENSSTEKKSIDDLIPMANMLLTYQNIDKYKADNIDLDTNNRWYIKY